MIYKIIMTLIYTIVLPIMIIPLYYATDCESTPFEIIKFLYMDLWGCE